ncbi:MAG TPA: enoyl-CoA hydratase family protein [Candidatus Binataceae bacterium]|nr:enoyl-CoA hydratase family protein [Candidatus Binataceae bacterium]
MGYDFVYEVDRGVATITLNRPEVLNALTFEVYAQLRDLFAALQHDDSVKVVIITGKDRAFCSGGDVEGIIAKLLEFDARGHLDFTRMTGAVVRNMRALGKPIIAAVNGMAAGAGAVIALGADLRILSDKARFAFLFTKVGLAGADMGAAYLLPKIVGIGRALELLFFGDTIDAATAERYGIANRVVPPEELTAVANQWARRLAEGPSMALSVTKHLVNNELNMDIGSAIESEAQAQALLMRGEDFRIFYEAFINKQPPKFVGR